MEGPTAVLIGGLVALDKVPGLEDEVVGIVVVTALVVVLMPLLSMLL